MCPGGSHVAFAPANRTRYEPVLGSSSAIRASLRPVPARATVNSTRPSGRAAGHQWPISSLAGSGFVTTVGVRPSAETIDSPDSQVLAKTIRPSDVHVEPGPPCRLHTASASPPAVDTL